MVFAALPRASHRKAQDAGAVYTLVPFYTPMDGPADEVLPARLVCSWCTTAEEIDRFLDLLKS